jgi:RimJ/RimL family protein N-acetyltransferase
VDEAHTHEVGIDDVIHRRQHVFSILDTASEELIGRCLLFDIDYVNRKAMLGILIGEKRYWDKGYGQEAFRLLLDYAFRLLKLNSIMLGVFAFNERALACYRRVGFKEIGRRRQARIIGDSKVDAVLMDILAEEFRQAPATSRGEVRAARQPLPRHRRSER